MVWSIPISFFSSFSFQIRTLSSSYTLSLSKIGDFGLSHIISQMIFNLQQSYIEISSILGFFFGVYINPPHSLFKETVAFFDEMPSMSAYFVNSVGVICQITDHWLSMPIESLSE
ncbi:hypothetical protein H5410_026600 [Solanum commersonii]|uniref:Uncharacterized protein n=1 Tax=Solanum commersonii TaxID=4109 RepID=A0A9J5Z152_SOLCO|nr:hypothetical protein H5410_026600 [Solanum commersonii]